VIDHHDRQNILEAEFTDIQKVESCATIIIEYIKDGIIDLSSNSKSKQIAVGLMHGLRSDTNNLIRAKEKDFMAATYISKYIDNELLNEILSIKRTRQTIDGIQKALEERQIIDNYSIAGIGYLRYQDRDVIPQAADFLITEDNIHTSIVYAIIVKEDNTEYINGSLRTSNIKLNADKFIKEAFGYNESKKFYGGGKNGAGAFEIPINFLSGSVHNSTENEFLKIKWQTYNAKIYDCLLKTIGITFETNKID
jgi:nanoRNase/pAp phosphatase (c-di-AMP/oligoRNAs hydrolase)